MTDQRKNLGTYGENLVLKQYVKAGYLLVEQNFRCRLGEIDLIMQKGDTLVFVEVRTKTTERFGDAVQSITPKKIQRIRLVSTFFLMSKKIKDVQIQYDVVTVWIDKKQKKAWINHYPGAF